MSEPQNTVRTLAYADLPQVIAIERESFPAPWSLAMFVLELSKPSSICLAHLDAEDDVIGYLVCSRYDAVWHIMNIAVAPSRRRSGIASSLLEELFERIDDPTAEHTLEVRRSNKAGIALYEHHGFRVVGIRKRYYADNREDALIMTFNSPRTREGPR